MAHSDMVRSALDVGMAFVVGAFVFLAAGWFGAEMWVAWVLAAAAAVLVTLGEP